MERLDDGHGSEVWTGARRRQRRRGQAAGDRAVRHAPLRGARARGGVTSGRSQRRRWGRGDGSGSRRASRPSARSASPADRPLRAASWPRRPRTSRRSLSNWAASRPTSFFPTPTSTPRPRWPPRSGRLSCAGQGCALPTRLYVHDDVHDAVVEKLVAVLATLQLGDPLDPAMFIGPVVTEAAMTRILAVIGTGEDGRSAAPDWRRARRRRRGLVRRADRVRRRPPGERSRPQRGFRPGAGDPPFP